MTEREGMLPRDVLDRLAQESLALRPPARGERVHVSPPLRVHVVSHEDPHAWILGKMARRLHEELLALGHAATFGREADPSAAINHHVIYWNYERRTPTLETLVVTHIDEVGELDKLRRQIVDLEADMGLCMSFEAVHRLAGLGLPREKLCVVGPAHDGLLPPRRTRVGITTRLYPDGRKREHLIVELARSVSPHDFAFSIMGSGWEAQVAELRALGFEVEYAPAFDYDAYRALLPTLDYFLYPGLDEGSIGFLDALAAGVATIVTAQGFHLDVPGGITHAFTGLADLQKVFAEIAAVKRKRQEAVAGLTWAAHARDHALVWEYLVLRQEGRAVPATLREELAALAVSGLDQAGG